MDNNEMIDRPDPVAEAYPDKPESAAPVPCGRIVLRLDRMMVERHISLNELAGRVGISQVNLSKLKNNHISAIRFSTLAAICGVLGCQPGDILEYRYD